MEAVLSIQNIRRDFSVRRGKFLMMIALSVLTFAVSFAASAESFHPRIINGYDASPHPWMASISYNGKSPLETHFCGGTLIDANTVLTAAHCVADFVGKPQAIQVVVDRTQLSSAEGKLVHAVGIVVHPDYWLQSYENDVALITLDQEVVLDSYPAIASNSNYRATNTRGTILGWGYTSTTNSERSDFLKEAEIPFVDNALCAERMAEDFNEQRMFCAGTLSSSKTSGDGVDSCNGDSGGPLLVNIEGVPTVVGLTSWGFECASSYSWGVYARTDVHRDWILSHPVATPYVITPPRITGRTRVGRMLTCEPGTWGGDPSAKLSYHWIDSKFGQLPGGRRQTYVIKPNSKGHQIICEVSKNSLRHTTKGRSNKVGPIR